jgi:hypothetical protein
MIMPDEREEKQAARAEPPKAEPARATAIADMLNVADSLRLLQQQAAQEAMKLPEKRLDDASPDGGAKPYTLRNDGDGKFTKINAFGDEVDEQGALTDEGKRTAAARAQAGIR